MITRDPLAFAYILAVPAVAAVSSIYGIYFRGKNLSGYLWLAVLVTGLFLMVLQPRRFFFPWKLWLPWGLFVALSITWSSRTQYGNIQPFLQMMTPFVVGLVASFAVRTPRAWALLARSFTVCLFFITMVYAVLPQGVGYSTAGSQGIGFAARPAAMTLCVIGAISLSNVGSGRVSDLWGWIGALALVVLSGSRTATVIMLVLWIISPYNRKIIGKAIAFVMMGLFGVMLFFSPMMQQRFFYSGEGSLREVAEGDFNTAGRVAVWPLVWREAQERPWFGAGVGEASMFVSRNFDTLRHVHNDFLRILFELGIVGLTIFTLTIAAQFFQLRKMIRRDSARRNPALVPAYLLLWAWILFFLTDNPLIYGPAFSHPIFAILGAAYGIDLALKKSKKTDPERFDF